MDLREYLFRKRISITDFAAKIRYNRVYLSKIINGSRIPGKKLAEDIEKATNGEVTAKELLHNTDEK